MSSIRSLIFKCYILLTISISLNRELMSPYSYYTKKGLVYIALIALLSRQLVSCLECTKANTYFSYDIRSVSANKYISSVYCC